MAAINSEMVDLTQLNIEEVIRKYGEEEMVKLMNMIIENSKKMLELQKMLVIVVATTYHNDK